MKVELICKNCSNIFNRYESALSKENFCSYRCFQQDKHNKTLNHNFFEEIDNENKSYWLGFLFADGNVSKRERKQKSINVALSSKDKEHLVKFANIFNVNVRIYSYNNFEQCVCCITSQKMWNDLIEKGLMPNKTYLNDGKIFEFVPEEFRKDFIRGFFDGDGGISFNKKTNGICCHMVGTEDILIRIKKYLVEKAFVSNVKLIKRKNVKDLFVLEWSGIQQLEAIRKFLYEGAETYLIRKFDRFEIIKKRYNEFLKNRKSKFRGIGKSGNKFMATIYHEGKSHYLGTFCTEEKAAKAYDKAIIKYGKPQYRLNFLLGK